MVTGHDDVLSLSQEVLLSLLSFCTACSITAFRPASVVTRHAARWTRWKRHRFSHARLVAADKSKLFRHLKKPQIITALNEAGLSGAAGTWRR